MTKRVIRRKIISAREMERAITKFIVGELTRKDEKGFAKNVEIKLKLSEISNCFIAHAYHILH